MADLTTLAEVRRYLGLAVDDTDPDELLQALITSESAWFERQCGRTILTATYTAEKHDGTGQTRLIPRNYPILSVSSLKIDDVAIPARATATGDGYVIVEQIRIELAGYTFTRGLQNVEITYSAGYGATPPADVSYAVQELVARRFKGRDRLGIQSQSVQGEVVNFSPHASSLGVEATIDAYRIPVVG